MPKMYKYSRYNTNCNCRKCSELHNGFQHTKRKSKSSYRKHKHAETPDPKKYFFEHLKNEVGGGDTEVSPDKYEIRICNECKGPRAHKENFENRCTTSPDYQASYENEYPNRIYELKTQNSRNYLTMVRPVHNMQPKWEKITAENLAEAKRCRYCPCMIKIRRTQPQRRNFNYCTEVEDDSRNFDRRYPERDRSEAHRSRKLDFECTRRKSRSPCRNERFQKVRDKSKHQRMKCHQSSSDQRITHKSGRQPENQRAKIVQEPELEYEEGSSQWSESDSELSSPPQNQKIFMSESRVERRSKRYSVENQNEDKNLSTSRYGYLEKRKVFSPVRQNQQITRDWKEETKNRVDYKTWTKNNVDQNEIKAEHPMSESEERKKSIEESQQSKFQTSGNIKEESQTITTEMKLLTQSEGGRRKFVKSTESKPMLSKFSQTQAELELDFKLLQRNKNPEQTTESKHSQTEIVQISKEVNTERSWDTWISEASKQKSKDTEEITNKLENKETQTSRQILLESEFQTPRNRPITAKISQSFPKITPTVISPSAKKSKSEHYGQNHEESYRKPIRRNRRPHQIPTPIPASDGLKLLKHSRSLSHTLLTQNNGEKRFGHSISSAPPKNPQSQNNSDNSSSLEFVTITNTTRTSLAMEQGGPKYSEETLRLISEQYDNLIVTEPVIQATVVRESETILNNSLEAMQSFSKTNLARTSPIINWNSDKGTFVWKTYSFRKLSNLPSNKCQHCQGQIDPEGNDVISLETYDHKFLRWHFPCFRCSKCSCHLRNERYYLLEDRIFCAQDYAEKIRVNVPKCHACSEFIFDESYTFAHGFAWHKNHFRCGGCQRPIVEGKYVTVHEQAFCLDCHKRLLSKKCNTCGLRIKATQEFVQSGDKFWHAKEPCFHCFTCHKSLVERRRMFEKTGQTFCNRYCALMNVPPG